MSMLDSTREAEYILDLFNLDIARYRIEHGMSGELATLYKRMGQLGKQLRDIKIDIEWLEKEFNRLTGVVQ